MPDFLPAEQVVPGKEGGTPVICTLPGTPGQCLSVSGGEEGEPSWWAWLPLL